MRKAGVLLPVSALMSQYGIGDFGPSAKFFVDFIAEMGFKVWQILPITTIGAGNSPYSAVSAFAGNYLLINIENLGEGLLTDEELESFKVECPYKVEYHFARVNKRKALQIAFARLDDESRIKYMDFANKEKDWLYDYALYMAIRDKKLAENVNDGNVNAEWTAWDRALIKREAKALDKFYQENKQAIEYYYYEQYVFYKQWKVLKEYANQRGVEIFGDMPIYVALNSSDVWANKDIFKLDNDYMPTEVAGVPPDYFAKDGQLWGNPIYDYSKLKENDYKWFIDRIVHNFKLYDILRIDHFRGLCQYWSVPADAETAKEGQWKDGPKGEIWKALKKRIKNANIVAEDLGIIDDKVEKFLIESGFPGMRVFQFAFDGNAKNPHLPYNYVKNCVAYTGTHDNDTSLGWLQNLDYNSRQRVFKYICISENDSWGAGGRYSIGVHAIAHQVIASAANMAILPMQDLCAYGSDTRTNIPGVAEGNWEYRLTLSALEDVDIEFYRYLLTTYGRM